MTANRSRIYLAIGLGALLSLLGFIAIRNLVDFPVYYKAGQSLISGRTDLYAPDFALGQVMDYRYPPFFLLLFLPVWFLPYKLAAYLWYLFFITLIAGSAYLVREMLKPRLSGWPSWLIIFLGVAVYHIIILHYGNAHLIATFCLLLSLFLVQKGKDVTAALSMALAITIKLTPGFLLLYFLLRKKWK